MRISWGTSYGRFLVSFPPFTIQAAAIFPSEHYATLNHIENSSRLHRKRREVIFLCGFDTTDGIHVVEVAFAPRGIVSRILSVGRNVEGLPLRWGINNSIIWRIGKLTQYRLGGSALLSQPSAILAYGKSYPVCPCHADRAAISDVRIRRNQHVPRRQASTSAVVIGQAPHSKPRHPGRIPTIYLLPPTIAALTPPRSHRAIPADCHTEERSVAAFRAVAKVEHAVRSTLYVSCH